ncbi:MAG TPA: radical SAM protein [Polyangiaceae bacterium]|nr:radical SAM protein [Polyangiaceae bacterium]
MSVVLVVPPPLRSTMGPALGPALVAAAVGRAGVSCRQRDLAIRFVMDTAGSAYREAPSTGLTGDHAKAPLVQELVERTGRIWSREVLAMDLDDWRIDSCAVSGDALCAALDKDLSQTQWGRFFDRHLFCVVEQPTVLGISVLFAAQVVPSLVLSSISKARWPGTTVAWGGAMPNLLGASIPTPEFTHRLIDIWWANQSLEEFVRGVTVGSQGASSPVEPTFELAELALYRQHELTLPYQCSRGCAYARCAYCTYPTVEGEYIAGDIRSHVAVLGRVVASTGVHRISFKDSLFTAGRLQQLATALHDSGISIEWSATTKASNALTRSVLANLAQAGLRTLEMGLETGIAQLQRVIQKHEEPRTALRIAEDCHAAGIRLVVNRIIGLPGETAEHRLTDDALFGDLSSRGAFIECNDFQLQRGSPMADAPEAYGLRVTRSWPWSSTLEFQQEDSFRY